MSKSSRRDFLRKGSVAGAVVAGVGLSRAGYAIQKGGKQQPLNYDQFPLDMRKVNALKDNEDLRKDYLAVVDETVEALLDDPELHIKFMENCDPMLLMKLFKENKTQLEPIIGVQDPSTREGRLTVVLHSGELFQNVAGVDYAPYGNDVDPQWDPFTCSGTLNGCCITHFWGWSGNPGAGL